MSKVLKDLRNSFLSVAQCAILLLAFSGVKSSSLTSQAVAETARPNIILCMADDQGWGDVGYYGKSIVKTPVLDEMAATGLRFDRFYAAAPVCSPTRGSVLTGRNPNRFACFEWGHSLKPEEVTIAEALKQAGYATGHFGKWHLGSVDARSDVSPGASGFDEWFSSPNFFDLNPLMSHKGQVIRTKGEGSEVIVDAAIKFIRACAENKQPFLAVVWFDSPHIPVFAVDKDRQLYADEPEALQNYYGEITAMDRSIGMLRDELKRLDVAKNTLLWYTSDNGPRGTLSKNPLGSTGGLRGRKGTLYEGGVRVPTIIEWPARIPKYRNTSISSGTVDIYPTLLDIVGVDVDKQPKPLDDISLLPLIDGKMTKRSKPMGFWSNFSNGQRTDSKEILEWLESDPSALKNAESISKSNDSDRQARTTAHIKMFAKRGLVGHAAWIDNRFKLHRIWNNRTGEVICELYDLDADQSESNNLASDMPDRVATMKENIEKWQWSVIHSLDGKDY